MSAYETDYCRGAQGKAREQNRQPARTTAAATRRVPVLTSRVRRALALWMQAMVGDREAARAESLEGAILAL